MTRRKVIKSYLLQYYKINKKNIINNNQHIKITFVCSRKKNLIHFWKKNKGEIFLVKKTFLPAGQYNHYFCNSYLALFMIYAIMTAKRYTTLKRIWILTGEKVEAKIFCLDLTPFKTIYLTFIKSSILILSLD